MRTIPSPCSALLLKDRRSNPCGDQYTRRVRRGGFPPSYVDLLGHPHQAYTGRVGRRGRPAASSTLAHARLAAARLVLTSERFGAPTRIVAQQSLAQLATALGDKLDTWRAHGLHQPPEERTNRLRWDQRNRPGHPSALRSVTDLTAEERAAVHELYADDIALYEQVLRKERARPWIDMAAWSVDQTT